MVEKIFFPKGYPKKINGETIWMPFRYSAFYPAEYELDKTNLIKTVCKPGDVVIDIGAHVGVFTFFLSKAVTQTGKVYSFEPAPVTYDVLQDTIRYNALGGIVSARQQAIHDKAGELTFYIYNNSEISNGNSISSTNTTGGSYPIQVEMILLDSLKSEIGDQHLSFIKIDAEGAELGILKGGQNLIKKHRPFITLEVHPKSFADPEAEKGAIYSFIKDLGYSIKKNKQELSQAEFLHFNTYFEVELIPDERH